MRTDVSEEYSKTMTKAARARWNKNTDTPPPWNARRSSVRLEKREHGEWWIRTPDGAGIPATDFEVSLWLELQDTRRALAAATGD